MAELREVAEAMVQAARLAFPVCPSPWGCEYCDHFGCPAQMAELAEAYPQHWDLQVVSLDGAIRYVLVRRGR